MRIVALTMALFLVRWDAEAQALRSFGLSGGPISGSPASNSINEIVISGDTLWVGTTRGLSYLAGTSQAWNNLKNVPPFGQSGISGIAVQGPTVWVATAKDTTVDKENLPMGDGLYRSTDRGSTWIRIAQPVDGGIVDTIVYGINRIRALNITTPINNLAYDIAIGAGAVWTANFAGMLRRSTDNGLTWSRVVIPPDGRNTIAPTDSLDFDLAPTGGRLGLRGNLNHRVFSVHVDLDGYVWAGTAGGINLSTDQGVSWRRFSHQNQSKPISGNFVVAIREQRWRGRKTIWAATVNAESQDESRAVSFTTDNGATWSVVLQGEFAHNVAFRDSVVYIAADEGLYRTSDAGISWSKSGSIVDESGLQRLITRQAVCVGAIGTTIWVGTPDGLASTTDDGISPFGFRWSIYRTSQSVAPATFTYVYPNPFSPSTEAARVHYAVPAGSGSTVAIRIFDFGMTPVRTLIAQVIRPPGQHDEIWDGRTDGGRQAANGVYFVRVEVGSAEAVWGKVVVLQ